MSEMFHCPRCLHTGLCRASDLQVCTACALEMPSGELERWSMGELRKLSHRVEGVIHDKPMKYQTGQWQHGVGVIDKEGAKFIPAEDAVNHPKHYNFGTIEVIAAIEDWGLGYHRGQVIKYTARAGRKNPEKEIEDLEKAVWYLKREIELLKAKKEGRATVKPDEMK